MPRGFDIAIWLKSKHLRAELNFWLWAAGTDLDDARDGMERLYLAYVALIVLGAAAACWLWLLDLATGAASAGGLQVAGAVAGGALALPACATAAWIVGAAWRSPWSPSAPDVAWCAQLPVSIAGWSVAELLLRLLTCVVAAGCAGYLAAACALAAAGLEANLATCLTYAAAVALATGAGRAFAWLVGEVRIRVGRAGRPVLVPCAVAAGAALVGLSLSLLPQLAVLSRTMLADGNLAPALAATGALLAGIAASALFAKRLTPALLSCEVSGDASLYATRRMAVYDPKLHRSLAKSRRAAARHPIGRMPRACGHAAVLARAAISLVRHYETLPQLIFAGAVVAPMGAVLLSGSLASQSAALGIMGGEAGARILGAASWIMLAVQGPDTQRALARTFLADTRYRFMRDHLPVPTPLLFVLGTLLALAVAVGSSAALAAGAVCLGMPPIDGAALLAGSIALDLALALCGSVSAADSARGRIRLSCETGTALVAAACALLATLLPAAWYPAAFWTVAALAAAAVFRSAR